MSTLPESIKDKVKELSDRYPRKQALTLPICHMVQDQMRCVPNGMIEEIADLLELSPSQIHDTLSFYQFFRDEDRPLGKKRLWICRSLSCMLRGSDQLLKDVCDHLHVQPGQTTADGMVTIEIAECLGACDGAPCILVDDELKLNVSPDQVLSIAAGDEA
jgi:NADH-quinone oxidoreductase subunit E